MPMEQLHGFASKSIIIAYYWLAGKWYLIRMKSSGWKI